MLYLIFSTLVLTILFWAIWYYRQHKLEIAFGDIVRKNMAYRHQILEDSVAVGQKWSANDAPFAYFDVVVLDIATNLYGNKCVLLGRIGDISDQKSMLLVHFIDVYTPKNPTEEQLKSLD